MRLGGLRHESLDVGGATHRTIRRISVLVPRSCSPQEIANRVFTPESLSDLESTPESSPFCVRSLTHTVTGGLTYQHQPTGFWAGTTVEYGSGTPTEREETTNARVPGHFTTNLSFGVDLFRRAKPRGRGCPCSSTSKTSRTICIAAPESEFAAGRDSIPRLVAVTAKVKF